MTHPTSETCGLWRRLQWIDEPFGECTGLFGGKRQMYAEKIITETRRDFFCAEHKPKEPGK
jgi:hypothetical protein